MKAFKAYQDMSVESAVLSANPLELVVMTYQRLMDHLGDLRQEIARGGDGFESFEKSLDLIQIGLLSALDFKRGGEIAKNLSSLYQWGVRELFRARREKSVVVMDQIIEAYSKVADAWAEVLARQRSDHLFEGSSVSRGFSGAARELASDSVSAQTATP